MYWDDLIRRWRRETRVNSPRLLRAAGGHVAVLPAPRRARQVRPLLVILAIVALVLLLLPKSGTSSGVTVTSPPAPSAHVLMVRDRDQQA